MQSLRLACRIEVSFASKLVAVTRREYVGTNLSDLFGRLSVMEAGIMSGPLPTDLLAFVESVTWTFAKTYAATWPHEYIVRDRVDHELFVKLVEHIRANGYEGSFYRRRITYFDHDGRVYWTMGAPIDETTIVNRCRKEQTYEYRRANGTLPGESST